MSELEKEITRIEKEMAAAFNRKDLEKVLEFFEPDLVGFSSTTHVRIQGLNDLKKTFEYYLQEGETVEYSISNIFLQNFGEVVVASFQWVVVLRDGDRVHEIPGRGTHVFHKKNNQWRVVHEHFSRVHHHKGSI
ncbi:MAG: YybH family protein [bacterium]